MNTQIISGKKISFLSFPRKGYGEVLSFLRKVNSHSYRGATLREIKKIFSRAEARVFAYDKKGRLVGCGCITRPTEWEREHCPAGAEWLVRAVAASVKGLGFYLWQQLLHELTRNTSAPNHHWQAHRSVVLYTGRRADFWEKVGFKPYKQCSKYCWMRTSICVLPDPPPP